MRRAAVWTILAAACGPAPTPTGRGQAPVVNGTLDADDPAVVAILLYGQTYCTGTLIAPHVVLTAAHCIDRRVDSAIRLDRMSVFVGPDVHAASATYDLLDGTMHEDWNLQTYANDLGLLVLDRSTGVAPWPLNTVALGPGTVGASARLVGYGSTAASSRDTGVKRQATSIVREVDETSFRYGDTPGQTCMGDSGSPAFLQILGSEVLAGVTSYGDAGCTDYGVAVRVDAFLESFVRPYLDAHPSECVTDGACHEDCSPWDPDCGERPRDLGERCASDDQCLTGLCLTALDDQTVRYCSQACRCADGSCEVCPTGPDGQALVCTATADPGQAVCAYPLPTPGAVGAPCRTSDDCAGGQCLLPPHAIAPICTRTCGALGGADCPLDYACEAHPTDLSLHVCLPAPRGGGWCAVRGARGGRGSLGTLAVLGAILSLAHVHKAHRYPHRRR